MYCIHCYKPLEEGTMICPSCGTYQSRNRKTPFYKLWWVWGILILSLIGGGFLWKKHAENITQTTQIETVIDSIHPLLNEFYEEYEVRLDDGVITVDVYHDGISDCASDAIEGRTDSIKNWMELSDDAVVHSRQISDMVGFMGIADTPVVINVVDDSRPGDVLLSASAGVILADLVAKTLGQDYAKASQSPAPTEYIPKEDPILSYSPTEAFVDTFTKPAQTEPKGTNYVLNLNTKKFHYPDCSSVGEMKEKNKSFYTGTRSEVIAMGYVPCKRCDP